MKNLEFRICHGEPDEPWHILVILRRAQDDNLSIAFYFLLYQTRCSWH